MAQKKTNEVDYSMHEKIMALYELQKIDSKIDEIDKIKGELPLEVEDLEDEIAGLTTRIENINAEIEELIAARTAAKKAKDYAEADRIRADLLARGIVLEDTREGTKYKITK